MDFNRALNASTNGAPADGLDAFDHAAPAAEFKPVPAGTYTARIVRGEMTTTRAGADAYRIRFEIAGGPHDGQSLIRTWTFGAKAMPYTKRDLSAFGLTASAQLRAPFPPAGKEITCRLVVALQCGDDGIERNDVKRIDVLRVTDTPAAAYLLPEGEGGTP